MANVTLGADKKSLIQLGIVLTVLVGVVYYQFFTGPDIPNSRAMASAPAPAPAAAPAAARTAPPKKQAKKAFRRGERFRPRMGRSESDAPPDPRTADPTLRIDLLAGVRGVVFEAIERDIFNFGVRKAPPPPPPSEDETRAAQQRLEEQIKRQQESRTAEPTVSKPSKPTMPRLTWKYYGLASKRGMGTRRGFLLNGEEIIIGGEGEVFEKRYKIKRIGLESIVIEDLEFNQEQTLSLTAPS